MTRQRYTLESIKAKSDSMDAELARRKERLRRRWDDLVAPPEVDDNLSLWANRAEAALSLYDGFMTGYKLLKTFDFLIPRKKKRKARKD